MTTSRPRQTAEHGGATAIEDVRASSNTLRALVAGELIVEEIHPLPRSRFRDGIGKIALVVGDLVAVAATLLICEAIGSHPLRPWAILLVPILWMLTAIAGLYGRDEHVVSKTTLDEGPRLLSVAAIFAVIVAAGPHAWSRGALEPVLVWGALALTLVVARSMARMAAARLTPPERVLVVGTELATGQITRALDQNAGINAVVVGRLVPNGAQEDNIASALARGIGDLPALLSKHHVERLIVVSAEAAGHEGIEVVAVAKAAGVKVSLMPPLLEVMGSSVVHDGLGGQALLSMRPFGLGRRSRALKRAFDLLIAAPALVVLSPVMAVIVLAVKLTSSGPAIFRQSRIGRDGQPFEMMKFRTMYVGADQLRDELRGQNQAAPLFKIANDPRITRVGGFLRRRSLDELPQLINVLRGDMSVVGPRPLVLEEDRLFSGWQRMRYCVAPGITGPWQVLGSTRVPFKDMVMLDYMYGANWSIWLDVKIVLRTIPAVFSRRSGEHQKPRG